MRARACSVFKNASASGNPLTLGHWAESSERARVSVSGAQVWQRQWSSPKTSTGKIYIKHSPTAFFRPAFFGESRVEQVSLSEIRLDKLNLNHKVLKENLYSTDLCDTCKKYENTERTLIECPRCREEKNEIYKSVNQETEKKYPCSPSWNPNQRKPEISPFLFQENGSAGPEQQRIRESRVNTLVRIGYTAWGSPVQKPNQPNSVVKSPFSSKLVL